MIIFSFCLTYVTSFSASISRSVLSTKVKMGMTQSTQSRMDERWKVWVTGASSGVGEQFAYLCAKRGAVLILSARRVEKLEAVARECLSLGAFEARILPLDQSASVEMISPIIDTALKDGLDMVLLNGGVSTRGRAIETEAKALEQVMQINFLSQAEIGRRVAADMINRGIQGRLVVTSSVQAFFGLPSRSGYAASKHALRAYFDSLRSEITEHGISVTVAAPGYIATELSQNAITADGTKYGQTDETTAKGASPVDVASVIFNAAERRDSEVFVFPGISALAASFLRTLAPSLLFYLTHKRALKEQETKLHNKDD
mmetsp:Transcript_2451/g.3307  ORF Transcript_2451/g.3307 Transcript_2451/m.3307 type:complete len:316 (-) Transcript_2451:11-958(-)